MASWGNALGNQNQQDMESPSGYHLIATKNSSTDAAIKGVNSQGVAIKAEGDLQVTGNIDTPSGPPSYDLNLGTGHAIEVNIGRDGIYTNVLGILNVQTQIDLHGWFNVELNQPDGAIAVVNNTSTDSSSAAISATGRTALQAHGHIAVDSGKVVTLDGSTGQNYITYNSANSRIEFYIGGTLRFVIDSTGGHNP
jgi:hypothetical protein